MGATIFYIYTSVFLVNNRFGLLLVPPNTFFGGIIAFYKVFTGVLFPFFAYTTGADRGVFLFIYLTFRAGVFYLLIGVDLEGGEGEGLGFLTNFSSYIAGSSFFDSVLNTFFITGFDSSGLGCCTF